MSKNILIVESHSDECFIESLKNHLNINDLDIDTPICSIDDYECLNGLSKESLERKLQEVQKDIEKRGIEKIGIVLDADEVGIESRVELINEALKIIDPNLHLPRSNQFITSEKLAVEVACHIMNVAGHGELDTVLKAIKAKPSPFADCLEDWRKCLEAKGKSIKDKNFIKFWVDIYQRFDCCAKKEQKQAGTKCNFEASVKKDIWDFNNSVLDELKAFLKLFMENGNK